MTFETNALLDHTGWQILRLLQDDARLPYSEIGRQVGLSAPAVAERVRRLEDAGVITGYHAAVDPTRMGYPILAIIRISSTGGAFGRCAEVARGIPEVLECHRVTGNDSFYLKVMVRSIVHLESLIDQLQPYGETTTTLVLSSAVTRRTIGHAPEERVGE